MITFALCPIDSLVDTRNRDYFANERTFLAYLRTALAFIAFGFVIARAIIGLIVAGALYAYR